MPEKAYLTYEEAMDYLRVRRSTLYTYVNDLDITIHKFKRDRRRYLAAADVERIKKIREQPWLGEEEGKRADKKEEALV